MAYALLFNEFPYGPRVRDKERIRGLILQNAEPHFIQVPAGQKARKQSVSMFNSLFNLFNSMFNSMFNVHVRQPKACLCNSFIN